MQLKENVLVTTSFLTTEEDYVQFQLAQQKAAQQNVQVLVTRVLGFLLILLGVAGLVFLNTSWYTSLVFDICVVGGLAIAFYYDTIQPYQIRRRAKKFFQTEGRRFVAQTALFYQDRVEVSTDRYEGSLPYSLYSKVLEDDNLFVFYTGEDEARFLPKRTLTDEQHAVLRNLLQTVLSTRFVVLPPQNTGRKNK